ncbi:MAG: PTS sugar transporter subunit IIB, partial [Traorella sp.]
REAIDKGAPIDKVTVGNMSNKVGSERVYHTVCVTDQDMKNFRYLANEKGVKFTAQMVPSDNPQDFMELTKNLFND